jgi:sec-independent protein translocase protein TatA
MFNMGGQELLILGVIVVLLFGGAKLPQLMKGMGEGIREFKKAVDPNEVAAAGEAKTGVEEESSKKV